MSTQAQTRKRAVFLTPEGVEALRSALIEKWRGEESSGKLTRERRAELLGLSAATSERVLNGKGVDRATLTLAFKNLGIPWHETYCHGVEAQEAAPIVNGSDTTLRFQFPRRSVLFALGGAFLLLTPLFASSGDRTERAASRPAVPSPAPDPAWVTLTNDKLYEGKEKYSQGDFEGALHFCREGIALARENHGASMLFLALQWTAGYEQALGAFSDAKAHLEEAAALQEIDNEEQNRHAVYNQLGDVEIKMGDYVSAGLHLDKALTLATDQENGAGICQAKVSLGWLAFKQGDLPVASLRYDQALAALPQPAVPRVVENIKARQALLLAAEYQANPASAQLLTDALARLTASLDFWKGQHHNRWIAYAEKQLGAVEALAGHYEVADALLAQSREDFKKVGDTVGANQAALLLSKSHHRSEYMRIWTSAL